MFVGTDDQEGFGMKYTIGERMIYSNGQCRSIENKVFVQKVCFISLVSREWFVT